MSGPHSPEMRTARISTMPAKLILAPTARTGLALAASISLPKSRDDSGGEVTAAVYARMQVVIQKMLHSDHGVPIRSHKRRLISAIPSAFTGADIVTWLMRNLSIATKAEAIHIGNLLSRHGFFFCVEDLDLPVKDDGTLFRFQTPYYWPSQNPSDSDFDYGVYLVKQVLRSKHRIRLLDYELNNLHKLKLRLASDWRLIASKAETDVKIFREQKRVAKAIISSQEEAFWRLHRPPPGESSVSDSTLSRHYLAKPEWRPRKWTADSLKEEIAFLKKNADIPRVKMSTALEGLIGFCKKYNEFDPMLSQPLPSNPWITSDTKLWTMEKSLLEFPTDRHVRKWACSFQALLCDVTGRYVFEKFCKSQYCLENVRFWQACRDLKSIPLGAVLDSVKLIYTEFLERNAASEVNVSAKVQVEVDRDLKHPTRYAFTAAQEQIYQLMQNDIYPRFLKSKIYQDLLKQGKEVDVGTRGFFSKFQYGLKKNRFELGETDATGISPCLPQRFTKRQLSISYKMSSNGSSSLDDIFLTTSASDTGLSSGERKRRSAYTEAFIDAISAPQPTKTNFNSLRRVSAPGPPALFVNSDSQRKDSLKNVSENEEIGPGYYNPTLFESMMPMSYSADDLNQLQYDADSVGPSKWKRFGIAAGFEMNGTVSPHQTVSPPPLASLQASLSPRLHPSRSMSHDLTLQTKELLEVPTFGFSTSPKTGSFEYESITTHTAGGLNRSHSVDSVHSTSSQ